MGSGATSQSPDKSLFIKPAPVKPSISMPVGASAAAPPKPSGAPVIAPVITTTGAPASVSPKPKAKVAAVGSAGGAAGTPKMVKK
jgi:hypothetical protein